eukprot:gene56625-biopygen87085
MTALVPFASIAFNVVLLRSCAARQAQLVGEALDCDENWNGCVDENGDMRDIVTGYRKGPVVSEKFTSSHKEASNVHFTSQCFESNVMWVAHWFPRAMISVLIFVYAGEVMDGRMEVGSMVALLQGLKVLGENLALGFKEMYALNNGFSSVVRISELLNSGRLFSNVKDALQKSLGLPE